MALSFVFRFGRLFNKGEKITNAKLNAVVKGVSADLSGTVGNADIAPAAIDPTKVQQGAYFYSTATLSVGTYTGVWTPAVSGYTDGMILAFKANVTNGGAVNLDAGAGAKPIRKWGIKALEVGDIAAGQVVNVRYNTTLVAGGVWELMGLPGQPVTDNYRYAVGTGSGGTPTVYAITLADAPAAYVAGLTVTFKASVNNTGNVQLNVNALGVKDLVHPDGFPTALATGEIVGGVTVTAVYDGTNFQAVSGLVPIYRAAEAVVASARNLVAKTNAGTPVSKADVTADELILKRATDGHTVLASAVNVTLDITLGVALNGLDAGVETVSTWYYLWIICDGLNVAGLISTSATAPTLPGTYLYKALAGVVFNDAGSNFVLFHQKGRRVFVRDTNNAVFTAATGPNGVWTVQLLGNFVPPIAVRVQGRIGTSAGGGLNCVASVAGDALGLGAQGCCCQDTALTQDGFAGAAAYDVPLATAQTVWWNTANNRAAYRLSVSGYEI